MIKRTDLRTNKRMMSSTGYIYKISDEKLEEVNDFNGKKYKDCFGEKMTLGDNRFFEIELGYIVEIKIERIQGMGIEIIEIIEFDNGTDQDDCADYIRDKYIPFKTKKDRAIQAVLALKLNVVEELNILTIINESDNNKHDFSDILV